MASSKTGGSWADLQDSLTRVRQQYGLLPRAGWESLIETITYENAVSAKQRYKNKPKSPLPSLNKHISNSQVQLRKENLRHTEGTIQNRHDRKEKHKDDNFDHKTGLVKKTVLHEPVKITLDRGLFTYLAESQRFAWDYVESLMSEMLHGEIVPDVVIEALTENSTQPWLQQQKLHNKANTREHKADAMLKSHSMFAMDKILSEAVDSLSIHVVRRTMKTFVDDHLMGSAIRNVMDEILSSIIQTELPSLIQEITDEIHLEAVLTNVIGSVINEDVKSILHVVLGECEDQISKIQQNQITKSANKYLIDTFLLDHLIGTIGAQKTVRFSRDTSLCLLDSCMLDILLRQHLRIQHVQQVTLENHSMKILHQQAFSNVALEVLLTELSMMIDEDMKDRFEYERDLQFGGVRDTI
ncbi:uncharacterized protein RCH25_007935 [Pelodytes ibericus]